jgi:monoamine oxidase
MARTPLFRFVERTLRWAQGVLATGEEPREIAERWAAPLSRRRLLAASAVMATGLAAGCKPRPTPEPSRRGRREVAIFGAGIAGLTAAWRLHQAGVPVKVYEAQNRVGGRMLSLRRRFPEGHPVELGGELIDTDHKHLRRLVAELGLELDDYSRDDAALAQEVFFFGGRRHSTAEVIAAFRPAAAGIVAARRSLRGDWVSRAAPAGGEALDRQSIAEWLAPIEMEPWFRALLDVAYTTEFGLEIAEQSALNLLLMIDPQPDPFRLFGDSDERFHIRGGNDQVPARLAERLGDRVVRGARLEAIAQAADGSYRFAVRQGETSIDVAADHAILTLPFTLLREVAIRLPLPAAKRRAIAELAYGTNAKLMVSFSQRLWRTVDGSNGSVLTDLPFQLTWETTRLERGESGILVDFTGGRRGVALGGGTTQAQADAFARDLDAVYPGVAALAGEAVRFHWPTHPFTRGSYACYRPGQYTAFGGDEATAIGNLRFAGEHTTIASRGYMEGGCESGERAAGEVLAALGRARPAAARAFLDSPAPSP